MIIFLDIDGVMVPIKNWLIPESLEDGFPAFTLDSIQTLKSLITEDTKIILTTSHRHRFTVDEWKEIFHKRNIQINNLTILFPSADFLNRKEEIIDWFVNFDYDEEFIIIDDDSMLNDLPLNLKSRLVLTQQMIGLKESDLELLNN